MIRRIVILLYTTLWCIAIGAQQQEQSFISGAVIDDETGDSISFASIVYKGQNLFFRNKSMRASINIHKKHRFTGGFFIAKNIIFGIV